MRCLELVHANVFKSATFEKFKRFKALVEKQTGRCIKALRTDRGDEFVSHEFNSFSEEHGLRRELIVPYTPEQNDVVERMNRTVVEMKRSMLKAKGLTNQLWAEVVATAVYLLNLSPTRVVLNQTPYEACISSDNDTPPNKFKTLAEIYASTQALFVVDPTTF
ncbi:hypothetical protein F3Y22_tig00001644pilonHSYRG00148 [Hibiscus syriacus]|uniref:Integrase catalytic domain-containing protein n=1 Tax=Hibiscus syriacus TaxID=106335 RepID=A0A6A3CUN9_HIBSY|nr:hypothetical protein F3Y22_tig00001644pilonHSYRG00148 [Hibiscus syriacus]